MKMRYSRYSRRDLPKKKGQRKAEKEADFCPDCVYAGNVVVRACMLCALEYAVKHYTTALAIVLHDKWDFGREELKTALLQIGDMYDSMARGYVNDRDIRAAILAETGLDLDRKITESS